MINVLLTGGAGFIGSSLAEKLLENPEIFLVVVDDLSTGISEKLPLYYKERYRFIKCNVNDYHDISAVFFAYHFDYVFHYAAVVGVKRTLDNPVKVLQDLHGIENILKLSKNSNVKRVFFSSSSEVYGEPVEFPQNEMTTPLNSKLPYAIVKNAGEAYLKSYHKEFGLPYTIFRFFNTYGPKQSKDFVISRFVSLALKNEDITIYGDGLQSRTFCYIDDNLQATYNHLMDAISDDKLPCDVINIGNNNETTIFELAGKIINICESTSQIVHLPALEEGDMRRRLPDISKMRHLIKRPLLTLDEGLEKLIQKTDFIL